MGQLIRFELSKILKKKNVYISMAAFGAIFGIMLYSWIFGNEWARNEAGENLYGAEAAACNEAVIERFHGPLTDDKVQEILAAFPRKEDTDIYDISNTIYYPVAQLFAEKDGSWNKKTVAEVFPEFTEPPRLGMASRWEAFLYSMTYIIMMAGIVLIIVISPIFSDEYTSGVDALILTLLHVDHKWSGVGIFCCQQDVLCIDHRIGCGIYHSFQTSGGVVSSVKLLQPG